MSATTDQAAGAEGTEPAGNARAPGASRPNRPSRVTRAAVVAGAATVFAAGVFAAWDFTVDDAYITFRYSEHLAEGHGPVWNVGGEAVEGFTNFGWMLLLAPFSALGADLAVVAKTMSLLIGLGVLAVLLRTVRESAGFAAALLPVAAFVVFLPTYFHLAGGLETMAFAAVVLRMTIVGLNALGGRTVRAWEPPVLFLVAGLLRPEGVLAALPPLAVWLWRERGNRQALFQTALAAAVGAVYFGWRWSFYGHPLPNTFYVKFGNLDAGTEWAEQTLLAFGPLLLLTGVLLMRRSTRAAGALLLAVVAATCLTYALSGPSMDYLHRFAFHAFPVLCLGAGLGVGLGVAALCRRWASVSAGVLVVAWVAMSGVVPTELPVIANYGPDLRRAHVAVGEGLARADVPAEQRSVAVSDAGAIPYVSGWDAIDYIGLNDEAVAHGEDPTRVVRDARPTVVVVTAYGPYVPRTAYGLRVREATTGYLHVAQIQMRDGYWQNVFVLPEWASTVASAITESARQARETHDPGRYELTFDRWLDRLAGRF